MAFAATMQWDVRTTGSDSNGGGFDATSGVPGTDYSQQDTAQVAYTDLVIGATTTQLTSAANPFTSAHVGNVINITAGTGFTVQRVQILSVSGSTATCDKSCGTAASTGGTGNLGGGLATPAKAVTLVISGHTIWVKNGTYTITASINPGNSLSWYLYGYGTTHGDNAASPTITTATNSIDMITMPINGSIRVMNLVLTTTATTKGNAFFGSGSLTAGYLKNIQATGFANGVFGSGGTLFTVEDCSFQSCSSAGISYNSGTVIIKNTFVRTTVSYGINISSAVVHITRTVVANSSTTHGIVVSGSFVVSLNGVTVTGHAGDGINVSGNILANGGAFLMESCIAYGNGVRGLTATLGAGGQSFMRNNAWGANTTANYSASIPAGSGDKTLSATPFTAASSGDYSLNSTAGGGALCKGAGYPGAFPGGLTTGSLDIGAVQSAGGTTSTGGNFGFVA